MLNYCIRFVYLFIILTVAVIAYPQSGFSLVSSTPAANATNVSSASQIVLRFNTSATPLGPVLVTLLESPGGLIAGTTSVSGGLNEVITFTPTTNLPTGLISVDYSAIQSTTGMMPYPSSFTFRVATIDIIPPIFTSSTPASSATGISRTPTISLVFSEPMNHVASIVTMTGPSGPVALTRISVSGATLSYQPTSMLDFNSLYTINYSGVRDANGNTITVANSITFTTISPPIFNLQSSVPTAGQQNAALNSAISLQFSNPPRAGSMITLQGGGENVPLTQNIAGSLLTANPLHILRPSTLYTINMNGVQDIYNQPITGAKTISFNTEKADFTISVNPPQINVEPNTAVGISYIIRNSTNIPITLTSDTAVFLINGVINTTIAAPLSQTIPANSIASLSATAQISDAILQAAKTANTADIVLQRTFTETSSGNKAVTIMHLHPGSSLASAATVTSVIIDKPANLVSIGQNDDVYPRAVIRGTGNGIVSGTWYVDDSPLDTFQMTIYAGQSLEIKMRRSLPSVNPGQHHINLRLTQPVAIISNTVRYQVTPRNTGTYQVVLSGPEESAVLSPDAVRTAYRWIPVPGAAGYDIAFASSPDALGISMKNNRYDQQSEWEKNGNIANGIVLLKHLPGDTTVWRPTLIEYKQLFTGNRRVLYWAVRARFNNEKNGDSSTTSAPRNVNLIPTPVSLQLNMPPDSAAVENYYPTFIWEASKGQPLYKFTINEDNKVVFTAMTADSHFSLREYMKFQLHPGRYTWQVMAFTTGKIMTAISTPREIIVKNNAAGLKTEKADNFDDGNVMPVNRPVFAIYHLNTASAIVTADITGTVKTVSLNPVDGATTDQPQPQLSGVFPAVKEQCIQLLLDDVDVTTLAEVLENSFKLIPPQPLANGTHMLTLVATAIDGSRIQASSIFTTTGVSDSSGLISGEPATDQQRQKLPVGVQINANWNGDNQNRSDNKILMSSNLCGEPRGNVLPGTYTALNFQLNSATRQRMEVSSLALETGAENGKLSGRLGDVGVSEGTFSISGLSSRGINVATQVGKMKFTATKSISEELGRKLYAKPPEVLVLTAEPMALSGGQSLKMVYVNQKQPSQPYDNFTGDSQSRVFSLLGQTQISNTGLSIQGELAKSNGKQASAFGDIATDGLAMSFGLSGQVMAYNCSLNYRQIDADFNSPASTMLSHDLAGWDFRVSRPLGKYMNAAVSYSTLHNAGSTTMPTSENSSVACDISMSLPQFPSLNLRVARDDAKCDQVTADSMSVKTQNNNWAVTASYPVDIWNFNVSYNHSAFVDFYDVKDVNNDTPRDRNNGTWSCGVDVQPFSKLRLRADWGLNNSGYAFRNWETNTLLNGKDDSRNLRLEAQYNPFQTLSLNCSWSRNSVNSAVNPGKNGEQCFDARLNYNIIPKFIGNHNFTLSAGWRKMQSVALNSPGSPGEFTIQLSDMLSFDL